ncbi:MAG: hypothetical protein IKN50_01745 [Clostridia bacterium]|nr:hypothetical protein [Clostridia bacterium]
MKEDIRERVIEAIDDDLIRDAYESENVTAGSAKRRSVGIKRAILIAAAVLLTVCGLLMLNGNVRAAVIETIRGSFLKRDGDVVGVSFVDPDAESETESVGSDVSAESVGSADAVSIHDVEIGYIPDGLIMEERDDFTGEVRWVYLEIEPGNEGRDFPYVQMSISRSGNFSHGFGKGVYDKYVYQSTINGMDAYVIETSCDSEGDQVEIDIILFGDENITVNIHSTGLNIEEVTKIAENIVW